MADAKDPAGFAYWVSDEMIDRFAASTPRQRLEWLEEMRTFTCNAAGSEVRAEWRRLREHPQGTR